MEANAATLLLIADNDLYTGREVKRLLAESIRDTAPYVKISAAAIMSGIPRSTLKAAARRYFQQIQDGERPPIRVRRTSSSAGAHWLFHEGDCWAASRDNPPQQGVPDKAQTPLETNEQIIAAYVLKTTQHISRRR